MASIDKILPCVDCGRSLIGQKVGATTTQRCNSCHRKRTANYSGTYCQHCDRKISEMYPGNRCGDCHRVDATRPRVANEAVLLNQHGGTNPKLLELKYGKTSSGGCVVLLPLLLSFMGFIALLIMAVF